MKILHVLLSHLPLPPTKYGGTERVVWSLAQAQKLHGHDVRFFWRRTKNMPEDTIFFDSARPLIDQIGQWPDIVHFHWPYKGELHKPFVCTEHGNANYARSYPMNTIFLSESHARNHGASFYIYNGLDWREYGKPNLDKPKNYFHFLGKAKAPSKNLHGAVRVASRADVKLRVLGGHRVNLTRNPYCYFSSNIRFHGMVGGEKKITLLRGSSGLIAPSRWHEPFGLAIIESLYLGSPVFATPFGSLPELLNQEDIGFLSKNYDELAEAIKAVDRYDRRLCHETAKKRFGMETMSQKYFGAYEKVISNEFLNETPPKADRSFIELLDIDIGHTTKPLGLYTT